MDDAGARPFQPPTPPQPETGVARRLGARGPKRVLAIDGGGLRGILAAGLLAAVEAQLRRRSGRADFRLCDYFDLIGGVSTGAVIAAALAMGRSAAEIADFFRELAAEGPARRGRYDLARMDALLARIFADTPLGGGAVRTGLAIGAKRVDAGGVWWAINTPRAALWESRRNGPGDKDLLVRELLQASLGGSLLHEERTVRFSGPAGQSAAGAVFVDAALAGVNNPSLSLLQLATLPGYGLDWLSGHDQLLMVSVGAGDWRGPVRKTSGDAGLAALEAMVRESGDSAIATLQGLSHAPRPWRLPGPAGETRANATLAPAPALHFHRMDARLDLEALQALGLTCGAQELDAMRDPLAADAVTLARLHEAGLRAGESSFQDVEGGAKRNWQAAIFPRRFDPHGFSRRLLGPPASKLDALRRAWNG